MTYGANNATSSTVNGKKRRSSTWQQPSRSTKYTKNICWLKTAIACNRNM